MKLIEIEKIKDGKYLKNYILKYLNKAGKEKKFEIVSYKELNSIEDIGKKSSGIAIVAVNNGKLLLLHEFRMGVNKYVYNLCAGRIEEGETVEECVRRELFEETGLELIKIKKALRPAYAAVALSDVSNQLIFAEVKGTISDQFSSENEEIIPAFYDKLEVENLLENYDFTSRAQAIAYAYINGALD